MKLRHLLCKQHSINFFFWGGLFQVVFFDGSEALAISGILTQKLGILPYTVGGMDAFLRGQMEVDF